MNLASAGFNTCCLVICGYSISTWFLSYLLSATVTILLAIASAGCVEELLQNKKYLFHSFFSKMKGIDGGMKQTNFPAILIVNCLLYYLSLLLLYSNGFLFSLLKEET
jgi:hypothetical protein